MGFKRRGQHTPFDSLITSAPADRQEDLRALDSLIRLAAPKLEPVESGKMMGYGPFHYRYASGREGDSVKIGVACNKNGFSLHCLGVDAGGYVAEQFASRFPKAKVGKSCVRFKQLADLELKAVSELVRKTAASGWG